MKASDYLTLPDVLENDIPVALDAAAAKAYHQLETELLLQVDEDTITAGAGAFVQNDHIKGPRIFEMLDQPSSIVSTG